MQTNRMAPATQRMVRSLCIENSSDSLIVHLSSGGHPGGMPMKPNSTAAPPPVAGGQAQCVRFSCPGKRRRISCHGPTPSGPGRA
jgi:hypothetical protein